MSSDAKLRNVNFRFNPIRISIPKNYFNLSILCGMLQLHWHALPSRLTDLGRNFKEFCGVQSKLHVLLNCVLKYRRSAIDTVNLKNIYKFLIKQGVPKKPCLKGCEDLLFYSVCLKEYNQHWFSCDQLQDLLLKTWHGRIMFHTSLCYHKCNWLSVRLLEWLHNRPKNLFLCVMEQKGSLLLLRKLAIGPNHKLTYYNLLTGIPDRNSTEVR